MIEVVLDVLLAEQGVREIAPAGEQLEGHLVLDHQLERRQAEARFVFFELVETPHALRREDAEKAIAEGVDDESVAESLRACGERTRWDCAATRGRRRPTAARPPNAAAWG